MADEIENSEAEVSSNIVAGMAIVHNLFNELDKLFRLIVQGLVALDVGVGSFGGKGFILPKARKGAAVADRFLKTDMGFYAQIGDADSDDPVESIDQVDEEDDDDEGSDGDDDNARRISVTPESQFLGVRAILYEPNSKGNAFSPCVVAALFSNLSQTSTKRGGGSAAQSFELKRPRLKRIVKAIGPNTRAADELYCRLPGFGMTACVVSALSKPVASFTSESEVNEFVKKLATMVEGA